MNIKQVRDILKKRGELSLAELVLETGEDKEHLEYVLLGWEKRGRVAVLTDDGFCSSPCKACALKTSCNPNDKRYKWLEGQ